MVNDDIIVDDMLPNDGAYFQPTPDQAYDPELRADMTQERAKVQAAAPLFEDILSWFDEEIAKTDSIDSLDLTGPLDLPAQLLAAKLMKNKLTSARSDLVSLRDSYIKS